MQWRQVDIYVEIDKFLFKIFKQTYFLQGQLGLLDEIDRKQQDNSEKLLNSDAYADKFFNFLTLLPRTSKANNY